MWPIARRVFLNFGSHCLLRTHRRQPSAQAIRHSSYYFLFDKVDTKKPMSTPMASPKKIEVEEVELDFVEEPLGLTANQGYGYFRVDFGETIGPDGRYEIKRKLGWGRNASIWLARDAHTSSSQLCTDGIMLELETLQRIASVPSDHPTHCVSLLDHFFHPSKDDDGASHLCLVTDIFGGTVASLMQNHTGRGLPVPLAKRILRHMLIGLAHAHGHGVVHTDLKFDNVMFDLGSISAQEIEIFLSKDPSRRHPPEASWPRGKIVEAAVSQPLPLPSLKEAFSRNFLITDFGSAQFVDQPVTNDITPYTLRAPETILQGAWDEKVDIWIFGCLIFESLTGCDLFTLESDECRPEEMHLYQMMVYTGERFTSDQLRESDLDVALSFFDPSTTFLRKLPKLYRQHIKDFIETCGTTTEQERLGAAALIERCFRLNPRQRPSAEDLLDDPWWSSE
ncbi:hypothetical protein EW146_g10394 [Bondarzewia mesenterica]|uniref:Protein kinase domain-containing protein n=1 Tax=Bondarzewia mesenterica TaxID=1095465 RepID=A0A4S4KXH2_9AGAM|nr:hypothetical protein EW146_g10394 [Bondarzewia mesenterica]